MMKHEQETDKVTFFIEVDCQNNATWQGKVTWAEQGRDMPFRSAMELLEIMDNALQEEKADWETEEVPEAL